MGKRKIKIKTKIKIKLFTTCPVCEGNGCTTTLELIDRPKYKGLRQRVKRHCEKCDHGYVPYKQ